MFNNGKAEKIQKNEMKELSDGECQLISGGIAESPPPAHDTLVRPGDTKGEPMRS